MLNMMTGCYLAVALLGFGPVIAMAAETGRASYYHDKFHGRTTACGQRFNQAKLTAAHRKLPCGAKVKVIRRDTGKAVVVTINDRGPWVRGRIIDLSKAAARRLGMLQRGVAPVSVVVLSHAQR